MSSYDDVQSESRKNDHINLALSSKTLNADDRFHYEPLFGHQNLSKIDLSSNFLHKKLKAPIWISSMTGGAKRAQDLNEKWARAAGKYGLGFSLGSCRSLLDSDKFLNDFKMRHHLGGDLPFYANLGLAQVDLLLKNGEEEKIENLIFKLEADGLIVHINPLQEWYQPEGDLVMRPALEVLEELISKVKTSLIVKEVGQGFGPKSLEALLNLPIDALDFGSFGGTNFSRIEQTRAVNAKPDDLTYVGHSALEMVSFLKSINKTKKQIIISGGIKSFIDGYYLMSLCPNPSIYAQASAFLAPALESYEHLCHHIEQQIDGLKMCHAFLHPKEETSL